MYFLKFFHLLQRSDRCKAKDHTDYTIFKPIYHPKAQNCRTFNEADRNIAALLSANEEELKMKLKTTQFYG